MSIDWLIVFLLGALFILMLAYKRSVAPKPGVFFVEHDGETSLYVARDNGHALQQHIKLFGVVGEPTVTGRAADCATISIADYRDGEDRTAMTAREWVPFNNFGLVGTTAGY